MNGPIFSSLAGAMFALGLSALAFDEIPPQDRIEEPRTIVSRSRRFVVSGLPAARAVEIGRWADDVADRIQRITGPLAFARGEHVQIEVKVHSANPLIEPMESCADGVRIYALRVEGIDSVDPEAAEEALGILLLNRQAQSLQSPPDRCERPARVPDWLAIALTHAANPDLRKRDLDAAVMRNFSGERTPFAALVDQHVMPPGRWPFKADATALWLWLAESPRGAGTLLADAFRKYAAGTPPDAAWWAGQRLGSPDPALAERRWQEWLDARQRAIRPAQDGSAEDAFLGAIRQIPREDLIAAKGPEDLAGQPLSSLIEHRKNAWCRQVAVRLAVQIRLSSIGREEEVRQIAESYASFLDALAKGDKPKKLMSLWNAAESRRQAYGVFAESRRRYLDEVEQQYLLERGTSDPVSRYLDEIEKRRNTLRP